MCFEIDKIQDNINLTFFCLIYLRENIIQVCLVHSALVASQTNRSHDIFDMLNFLCDWIINYKVIHNSVSTQTYIQFANNKDNHEMFFTEH